MQTEAYNVQDLLSLMRRRSALMGGVALAVFLTTVVVTYSLQSLYRSTGTIIIERPEVALDTTFGDTNREQRISRISDEAMTRDNLAAIVEKFDLYREERGDGPARSVASLVRKNTEIRLLYADDDPRSQKQGEVTGFTISFYYPEPRTARDVARELVRLYLEANRGRREDAFDEAAAALGNEVDKLGAEVEAAERVLADFKKQHPNELPDDRKYNIQIMERKSRDLDGLDREIRSLQERKTLLQSQLAQTDLWITTIGPGGEALPASAERLRALQSEYLRLLGSYSASHPDVVRVRREIESLSGGSADPAFRDALMTELLSKKAELRDLQTQYGPEHPDVRAQERAVRSLEEQLAAMPERRAESPPPNNPVYLNLQVQLQGVENELRALRVNRNRVRDEIAELDSRVQVAPEVERRYLQLTRDLDIARKQYESIRSQWMSMRRRGTFSDEELYETYEELRSPGLAFEPAFPKRSLFMAVGAFLSLTIGLGAGLAAEGLDTTIRGTRDVKNVLDMPPIAAIPTVFTDEDLQRLRTRRLVTSLATIGVVALVALYSHLQRSGTI
jgi:uncharacterized protein involved in exopolysaccharide biosynthesis